MAKTGVAMAALTTSADTIVAKIRLECCMGFDLLVAGKLNALTKETFPTNWQRHVLTLKFEPHDAKAALPHPQAKQKELFEDRKRWLSEVYLPHLTEQVRRAPSETGLFSKSFSERMGADQN